MAKTRRVRRASPRRRGYGFRFYRPEAQLLEERLLLSGGAPVAYPELYTVFHDRGLIATTPASGVLAPDTDPNGYPLTAVLVTNVSHGTLTLNSNGTFVYMPTPGFYGTDTFVYEAYDGHLYSSPETDTITVQENAPVASNGSFSLVHDRTLAATVPATDLENDALTATLVTGVSHGKLTLNSSGSFTYTPNLHYVGSDSFSYKVSDGILPSGTGTITLTVTDSAPVAYNNYWVDTAGVSFSSAITPNFGVQYLAYDANLDTLTTQVVAQPAHGTVTMASNGSFVYTPNSGFAGLDMFTFDDSDGIDTSNTATAYIYVGTQSVISGGTPFTAPLATEGSATSATTPFLYWYFELGSISDYTAMVQWGDGTESQGTLVEYKAGPKQPSEPVVQGSHTYTEAGSYPITVAILGDATAQNSMAIFTNAVTATISDIALVPTGLSFSALANQPNILEVATFTDADPNANVSKYTATINWGNGTTTNATIVTDPSGGGKFDVYGIDPYTAAGTDSVTVQINDLGGATTTAPSTATVTASPITASNANPSATAGTPFSGTVATFFDTTPGATVSNLTTKINWGDGTSGYGAVIQDPTVSGQYDVIGTHTYTTPGSETVSISIKDQNGVYAVLERHDGGRRRADRRRRHEPDSYRRPVL